MSPLLTSMGTPFPAQGSTTGIGATLTIQLIGQAELLARLQQVARDLQSQIITTAMYKAMLVVARTAAVRYLTGPRPSILGVKTNLLRSSLMPSGASAPNSSDTIWEIRQSGDTVEGRLGTRVKYGPVHEEGWELQPRTQPYMVFFWEARGVWVRTRRVVMPRRPFLGPAVEWSEPDVNTVFNTEIAGALTRRGL